MKAPTIEELKAQFTELGYKWPTIHVVGIAMENSACWDDFVDFLYESPVTTIPQWVK